HAERRQAEIFQEIEKIGLILHLSTINDYSQSKSEVKVHEYQAKEILRKFGVATPRNVVCRSPDEVPDAMAQLGGKVWVVKAQIHAGGRGKGGGVRVVHSEHDAVQAARDIMQRPLVTPQTGPQGQPVRRLLVEEGVPIQSEIYAGLVVDRTTQRVVLMVSPEGGMEIEEVAARSPERIHKTFIDPQVGLTDTDAQSAARFCSVPEELVASAAEFLISLYSAFWDSDASLAEINPLVVTTDGRVIALDAKMTFDDSAIYRNSQLSQYRDLDEESPEEIEASDAGLTYISLDGNIGCLVNGAGLAMATMDIIKLYGEEPANFLDVGGGATTEQVISAFKIMLGNDQIRAVLVNIFGGIMRCDVIAEGLVTAFSQIELNVPVVVRLEGTNVERGKQILSDSGLTLILADTMDDAAAKVVRAVRGD
ncbi:MAG: ADP-forming succinate--CoA ligase subunit beta, partial [Acidiferrobacterales bacterium]|nr:ADP-forming succinate--CoA ligase subunit beta [Acidiferrobacterales bacterium]